nr:sarcosine oxidase subunit alpha family protein [uncultured Cohaesibacter sp.]
MNQNEHITISQIGEVWPDIRKETLVVPQELVALTKQINSPGKGVSMTVNRLPTGGRINRQRPFRFRFNNRYYLGYEGDTLASALLANDVHLVSRSMRFGRPRGILCAGSEEPNAIVQVNIAKRSEPNVRATDTFLHAGLLAKSVNPWPSFGYDWKSPILAFSRLLGKRPQLKLTVGSRLLWKHIVTPFLRRRAGFGMAPTEADPDYYDHKYEHVDVLIVGAGPAGLAAARDIAASGTRTILIDAQNECGGSLLSHHRVIDGKSGMDWVSEITAEIKRTDTTILSHTTAFGHYDRNCIVAVERRLDHKGEASSSGNVRERLWHITAKKIILATGAIERPLTFTNNDRPGIMLASAVQSYVNRYAVLPGKSVILFTNNDAAYEAALDFRKAGGDLVAVIDTRQDPSGPLVEELFATGTRLYKGCVVTDTLGTTKFSGLDVTRWDGKALTGRGERLESELLMVSGGWNPTTHLLKQPSGELVYNQAICAFVPKGAGRKDIAIIGSANGEFTLSQTLNSGSREGFRTTKLIGKPIRKSARRYKISEPEMSAIEACWLTPDGDNKKSYAYRFVDYQNDVTAADIIRSAKEGFDTAALMMRYTSCGSGPDQGKTCVMNAIAILAKQTRQSIPEVGSKPEASQFAPVSFGALAGRYKSNLFAPVRTTAMHQAHIEAGATFETVGQWKRPHYYPVGGEDMAQAIKRESRAVRTSVGMIDVSTLGKFIIEGPDAAEFLDRVYINRVSNLAIGACRYAMMCHEDGTVLDDGIVAHIDENRFFVTCTTRGANSAQPHIQNLLQTKWPELKVFYTSVTEQYAAIAINGPNSRALMLELCPDIDWSKEAFPYLTSRKIKLLGVDAHIFRVSFTGELAFEIMLPARYGQSLWDHIARIGANYEITSYGTETMHLLRAEKGYILVAQETDGNQTPQDLGLSWLISNQKKDYIGKHSHPRMDLKGTNRKKLVGLLTENPEFVLDEGAQILENPDAPTPIPMCGYVTSSYWSETLGHSIALALIEGGLQRKGEQLHSFSLGNWQKVTVVDPVFYDVEEAHRD